LNGIIFPLASAFVGVVTNKTTAYLSGVSNENLKFELFLWIT